jgi:hypothetical protein
MHGRGVASSYCFSRMSFWPWERRDKQFCSNACRQRNHRIDKAMREFLTGGGAKWLRQLNVTRH